MATCCKHAWTYVIKPLCICFTLHLLLHRAHNHWGAATVRTVLPMAECSPLIQISGCAAGSSFASCNMPANR